MQGPYTYTGCELDGIELRKGQRCPKCGGEARPVASSHPPKNGPRLCTVEVDGRPCGRPEWEHRSSTGVFTDEVVQKLSAATLDEYARMVPMAPEGHGFRP